MTQERLVGRLAPDGKQAIGEMVGGTQAQRILDAAKEDQYAAYERDATELTERIDALDSLIRARMALERYNVVQTVMLYARDCIERSKKLDELGEKPRASAYKVRSAIAADIAMKIETFWGRNPDGTPQESADVESSDVLAEAAG